MTSDNSNIDSVLGLSTQPNVIVLSLALVQHIIVCQVNSHLRLESLRINTKLEVFFVVVLICNSAYL